MSTAAEDRALFEHFRTLCRAKLTLNEDEVWVLLRLIVVERSDGTPTLLPGLSREHDHAMGTALAKLSDARIGLTAPKEGEV